MNDIRRTVLWVIFGFSMVLLWDQWQVHNGNKATFFPAQPKQIQTEQRSADIELGKKEVRMIYDIENRSWLCTTSGTANPIPMQYLPSACK